MENSMKKALAYVFIAIIGFFFLICVLLEFVVIPSKITTNIGNSDWITITITYFAGTMGGLIAFGGIAWQLNHEKKEKTNRMKIYLKYFLELNFENKFLERNLLLGESLVNMSELSLSTKKEKNEYINEFPSEYINNNIDEILKLKSISKEIIQLEKLIKLYNEKVSELMIISSKRVSLFDELKTEAVAKENQYIYEIISLFTSIIIRVKTGRETEGFEENIKNLIEKFLDKETLESVESDINEFKKDFKEADFVEKLEKITKINFSYLKFIDDFLIFKSIKFILDENEEKNKNIKEFYNYHILNKETIGVALNIYNLLNTINRKL